MVALSHGFVTYLPVTVVAMIAAAVAIRYTLKQPRGKRAFHKTLLRLPVLGGVLQKISVARFTRTLGTLLASGVPILDAMDIVARTAGNAVISKGILYAREQIAQGKDIASPLLETAIFPPMVVQMIGVGEQTGAMDEMLQKIADFYEDEVDAAVAALSALLEPLILVFLGVGVGGMLIAMYLPIFDVAGGIK
jgi:type IV pilus assembly protein PilC